LQHPYVLAQHFKCSMSSLPAQMMALFIYEACH
jgi:hypothetical protein